ncbi:hypothetical protein GCM10009609_43480 [Pseudonocardia aurantiaca]|uniref:Uncharacterized protein n=1 Tax=Pseudonocardia aurantiaca TaxID=75290 RepID=A0ABW4FZB3_9PSEU
MSEYQYYEFAAVDRALDKRELDQLRALSTRAHITPTSFVNTYEWGNFRGDPRALMERYFDAFLYLANWGTHELMLRVPARLVDLDTAQLYCVGDAARAWSRGEHVIVSASSEDAEADFDWGGEGVLASILPVRSELVSGDLRALYLLWLMSVQSGEVEDGTLEPPVPPGLGALTGSQAALAEFLRIDADLLRAAAVASGPDQQGDPARELAAWIEGLPATDRDELLLELLRGEDPHLRAVTLRRARPSAGASSGDRSAGQLLDAARARRLERERAEQHRRDAAAAERAKHAAAVRERRLAALAAEGDGVWHRIDALIAAKKPAEYDTAVGILEDLSEVSADEDFSRRIGELRLEHRRKPALMARLDRAGL